MHRDPRFADVERFLGELTLCPGLSVLFPWIVGWDSMLLKWLESGWRYGWIALFLLVGGAMIAASRIWDTRYRVALLFMCAGLWFAVGIASYSLKLPVSFMFAIVIFLACVKAIRGLRDNT